MPVVVGLVVLSVIYGLVVEDPVVDFSDVLSSVVVGFAGDVVSAGKVDDEDSSGVVDVSDALKRVLPSVDITLVVVPLSVELASVEVVYGVVFVFVVVPSVVVLYVVLGGSTVVLVPPAFGVLEISAPVVVTIPIVLVVSAAPVMLCVVCCSEVLAAVVCG